MTAMKDLTKDIGGISAIEELQDDMQELQDDANDISEILTRTNDNDFDDDELLQELTQLELEEELAFQETKKNLVGLQKYRIHH